MKPPSISWPSILNCKQELKLFNHQDAVFNKCHHVPHFLLNLPWEIHLIKSFLTSLVPNSYLSSPRGELFEMHTTTFFFFFIPVISKTASKALSSWASYHLVFGIISGQHKVWQPETTQKPFNEWGTINVVTNTLDSQVRLKNKTAQVIRILEQCQK